MKKAQKAKAFIATVALFLFLAACSADKQYLSTSGDSIAAYRSIPPSNLLETTETSAPTKSSIVAPRATIDIGAMELTSGLVSFTECDELLRYLQDEALKRVGPYGLEGSGWVGIPRMALAESAFADSGSFTNLTQGTGYSGTNVQEAGIDEPDFIKSDGKKIVILQDDTLYVVDPTDPSSSPVGSLTLEGLSWGSELFLYDNRAWVLAHVNPFEFESPLRQIITPGSWQPFASIIEIDLTDLRSPNKVSSMMIEGRYLNARVVNGIARVVVSTGPDDLGFVNPQNPSADERAKKTNQQVISESKIENWLPFYIHEDEKGNFEKKRLVDCEQVSHPITFSGFSSLSVINIDLGKSMQSPSATSVLTDGEIIYASEKNLYVTTTDYPQPILFDEETIEEKNNDFNTSIHQFTMESTKTTDYLSSIEIPGHLLNQFSMSEHNGHLRVATTIGAPWAFEEKNESLVVAIEIGESGLTEVGRVAGMGKGEKIFAVRFMGDSAYVVTFRQTDPFYTLDLKDPSSPKIKGELKMNGYSGYLHPVGENLILGIGQDATDDGEMTGAKVTLFEVSDIESPKALDDWTPGSGRSSAEWDHRAFLWWSPQKFASLPFTDWMANKSEAVILEIKDLKIREKGRISHLPQDILEGSSFDFYSPIERTMVLDNEIWSYSHGQIQSNSMEDLMVNKVILLDDSETGS